jgi:hypothetical protein
VLFSSSNIDLGGQGQGINLAVQSYRMQIGIDDGGVTWQTQVTLQELAL